MGRDRTPALAEGHVDELQFRQACSRFATGVTVITAVGGAGPVGFAANSFTSVSLDPPLVLFCAGHSSTTWPHIREAGVFAVSILAAAQETAAASFARQGDRFADVAWSPGPATGSPVLEGALSWFDCRIESIVEAGDHDIVLGRVLALGDAGGRAPLVFFSGAYGGLRAGG